ncbi:MAG: glutathione S-transferase [Sulfitobacter sp.]|nr:glutathione S-transferase [Sulfitobacter sp.]MDG1354285.1 glutathione S-transferase [Sulfitobacter sp.]
MLTQPLLYSFRRCPYAMRARLALLASRQQVELREVVLRDKPDEFLAVSPSGTVPCLMAGDTVLDESLDIMIWALSQNDPQGWLDMSKAGHALIARADGPFKHALDRTKYAARYPEEDAAEHRAYASAFLADLDAQLGDWLYERPTLADYAILPFVRQFAFIDKTWFDAQPWPSLQRWLETFLASPEFNAIMDKYPQWRAGDPAIRFPTGSRATVRRPTWLRCAV